MFSRLNLHGGKADILWGHRSAVVLKHWRVIKRQRTAEVNHGVVTLGSPEWVLTGTPERIDSYSSRQTPLLLAVPRPHGFFLWPVEKIEQLGPTSIRATLGPPEQ